MTPTTPKINAYRVLGLPSTASTPDITARGKELLSLIKIGETPSYPLDLSPSDTSLRTEARVREAIEQLKGDQAREVHRAFWYDPNERQGLDRASVQYLAGTRSLDSVEDMGTLLSEVTRVASTSSSDVRRLLFGASSTPVASFIDQLTRDGKNTKQALSMIAVAGGSQAELGKQVVANIEKQLGEEFEQLEKLPKDARALRTVLEARIEALRILAAKINDVKPLSELHLLRREVLRDVRGLSVQIANELEDYALSSDVLKIAEDLAVDADQRKELVTDRATLTRIDANSHIEDLTEALKAEKWDVVVKLVDSILAKSPAHPERDTLLKVQTNAQQKLDARGFRRLLWTAAAIAVALWYALSPSDSKDKVENSTYQPPSAPGPSQTNSGGGWDARKQNDETYRRYEEQQAEERKREQREQAEEDRKLREEREQDEADRALFDAEAREELDGINSDKQSISFDRQGLSQLSLEVDAAERAFRKAKLDYELNRISFDEAQRALNKLNGLVDDYNTFKDRINQAIERLDERVRNYNFKYVNNGR